MLECWCPHCFMSCCNETGMITRTNAGIIEFIELYISIYLHDKTSWRFSLQSHLQQTAYNILCTTRSAYTTMQYIHAALARTHTHRHMLTHTPHTDTLTHHTQTHSHTTHRHTHTPHTDTLAHHTQTHL